MLFLVTGVAGFIGSQVAEELLALNHQVKGIDCFTDYYPTSLKQDNLNNLRAHERFELINQDLVTADYAAFLPEVEVIIHLAAQAGVRRSWGREFSAYTHHNVLATQMLLEAAKQYGVRRVVYGGSSSVYGDTKDLPMRETSACWPVSPYGVTKLAAEHLCLLYHKNFGLETACLRYFTVYGPRQRPDMAFHRFLRALLEDGEIKLFGDGSQSRDFTYVGDVVRATIGAALTPQANGLVFNIGGGNRISINEVIALMEDLTGSKARVAREAVAKGDVRDTEADTGLARDILNFKPDYDLRKGLKAEKEWVESRLPLLRGASC